MPRDCFVQAAVALAAVAAAGHRAPVPDFPAEIPARMAIALAAGASALLLLQLRVCGRAARPRTRALRSEP